MNEIDENIKIQFYNELKDEIKCFINDSDAQRSFFFLFSFFLINFLKFLDFF